MSGILGVIKWLLSLFLGKSETTVAVEQARAAGVAQEAAMVANAGAKTQAAVAQAEANAPKTQAAVVDELNKGEF